MTLQAITADLHVAQSTFYQTNSGVFISQGQALLIDPNMRPDEIDGIAAWVTAQGAAPRWLLLTHWHWDHILGPERMPGVPVLAHARYAVEAAAYEDELHAELAHWETHGGPPRETPFVIPRPDAVFEHGHKLALGALTLELLHVPGHAADQAAVYEPESGCLWAADILSDVEIPFVSDSLADYQASLDMLAGYDLRVLVPGHGAPTREPAEIRARLDEDRAYLAELRGLVSAALGRGQSLEETQAVCAGLRFRRPEDNAREHRRNVAQAYSELKDE